MPELMKGHKWGEKKHKVKYPVLAEAKIDEIRVHAILYTSGVKFLSYAGKPLCNMEFFAPQLGEVMLSMHLAELDLGFEVNGNFNDSYRWVRSSNGLPDDLRNAKVQFNLYDVPDGTWKHANAPYLERKQHLQDIAEKAYQKKFPLTVLPHVFCVTEEQVEQAYTEAIRLGREGLMVKSVDHLYKRGKRTNDWLKMKPEEEADGKIVALVEAKAVTNSSTHSVGDPLGRTGSIVVLLEDGSTATPAGIAHDLGFEMHQNPEKFIGQWIMFKYMERDRAGGYRHPSFVRFREDKQ